MDKKFLTKLRKFVIAAFCVAVLSLLCQVIVGIYERDLYKLLLAGVNLYLAVKFWGWQKNIKKEILTARG